MGVLARDVAKAYRDDDRARYLAALFRLQLVAGQYAQAIDYKPGGRAAALHHFGHYEDVYVRTPQGWRFKSRRFVNESQAALGKK